ncbi:class I SAM-dependent methyltransferase [Polaromonas sp. YR568]|uniref:class I SAM-dependent methyltransferase n=1 Tax=Polaromonas sp. YR568 TaxID=1855301 RepID=UPI0031383F6C
MNSPVSNLTPPAPAAPAAGPDLAAVKQKQQAAWSSGDYAVVGTTLQIVGEALCEAADVLTGESVLDVAAGNGNATLAAARRGANVVSTDYVGGLLERGRSRAEAEGLSVTFEIADAEALPYADGQFDLVLSTFGVMFTPHQDKAAAEMLRVCRSGGRIALANWTPDGFIGQVFKTIGKHLPPPAGVQSPALWGTEPHLQALCGAGASEIRCTKRQFSFRYRSAAHWLEVFRTWYGPVHKAFLALGDKGPALESDLLALLARFNTRGEASLVIPSDYLEIVITRQ